MEDEFMLSAYTAKDIAYIFYQLDHDKKIQERRNFSWRLTNLHQLCSANRKKGQLSVAQFTSHLRICCPQMRKPGKGGEGGEKKPQPHSQEQFPFSAELQ
ncbi:hypothetical protein L345_00286, partial [Ophiophagus hannah]